MLNRSKAAIVLASALAICAAALACGGSGEVEYSRFGTYSATIESTKGTIEVDLYNDIAYIYVENFINLAQSGFYDGALWHRVIPGFVIQAGINPEGRQADRFDDVFHPDMKHNDAGILSMANSGLNTNTSQFFITHAPAPHLDPYVNGELKPCAAPDVSCHAVFGKVTSGIEAVFNTRSDTGDKIESIVIHDIGR